MRIPRPARLYGLLARAEMVTWALLLLGMLAKYVLAQEWATRVAGGVHGFVFLSYALVTVLVAVDHRWAAKDVAVGVGSAVVPFATLPFERSAERRGLVDGDWRLLRAEGPRTSLERLVGWCLAKPLLAGALAVVLLAGVFGVLLRLGPPTRWVG